MLPGQRQIHTERSGEPLGLMVAIAESSLGTGCGNVGEKLLNLNNVIPQIFHRPLQWQKLLMRPAQQRSNLGDRP